MGELKWDGEFSIYPVPRRRWVKFLYDTKKEWVVTTSKGNKIPFKQDTGLCKGMPYIDMRNFKEGAIMIETVCNNFKNFTKKEIDAAKLSRATQSIIGHLPDKVFK